MITIRESTKHFTKEHRGATQEQLLEAVGGAIQELAGNQHELGSMMKELGKQVSESSDRQIAASRELVSGVMNEVRDWQKTVDKHLQDIDHCRQVHGKILEKAEEHIRTDKPMEHVLNERLGKWLIGILGTLAGGAVMWAVNIAVQNFRGG